MKKTDLLFRRSVRSQMANDDDDYDAVYEIVSGIPSNSWPLNVSSWWQNNAAFFHKKGSNSTQNRQRLVACAIAEAEDINDLSGLEEAEVEEPGDFMQNEMNHDFMLSDFVMKKKQQAKNPKSFKRLSKNGIWADDKDSKLSKIIYIEKEEYHHKGRLYMCPCLIMIIIQNRKYSIND